MLAVGVSKGDGAGGDGGTRGDAGGGNVPLSGGDTLEGRAEGGRSGGGARGGGDRGSGGGGDV